MTDRVRVLTVILDGDYRDEEESVDRIVEAIRMLAPVADVKKHIVSSEDVYARMIAKSELRREIFDALNEVFDDKRKVSR